MDINELKQVIACCSDYGTTRDEVGTRLTFTYKALRDSAETQGIELPSAKRTFAAMRDLGFEEATGGTVRRMAAPLLTVVGPIIAEAAQSTLAKYEASK